MNKRKLAAALMLFSGVAHIAQLFIVGTDNPNNVNGSLQRAVYIIWIVGANNK